MARKIVVLIMACMMLISAFSGCGEKTEVQPAASEAVQASTEVDAQAAEKVVELSGEVTFMTYRDDLLNTWYPGVIEEFKAKFPEIKIITSTSKNYEADVKVKMAANDLPDIITLSMGGFNEEQKSEYLMSVEEYAPELMSDWEGLDSSKSADGSKTYGLTYGLNTYGIIYNKKLYTQLGLTAPKTFDQLIGNGLKLKEAGYIGLAGCMKPGWTFSVYTDTMPRYFVDDFKAAQKQMSENDAPFTLDGPHGKTFDVIKKLADARIYEDDPASYDWEPMKKDFASGKTGMYYGWSNMLAQLYGDGSVITQDDLGFVPFPYDNSGTYKVSFEADWDLCVTKGAKDIELVKVLYNFLMDEKYAEYIKATGVMSARKSLKVENAAFNEFNSCNPVKVFNVGTDPDFKAVSDKAQIDFAKEAIKVALGKDKNEVLATMNDVWKKARATK